MIFNDKMGLKQGTFWGKRELIFAVRIKERNYGGKRVKIRRFSSFVH